jgi:diguanylate cyclase (GGDEF)-like protein
MGWPARFEPRDPVVASKIATGFICSASTISLVFASSSTASSDVAGLVLSYVLPVALVVLSVVLLKYRPRVPLLVWPLVPLAGVVVIAVLDISTRDASVGAQIFFLFPVLYAASQLRRAGAYAIAIIAAICEGYVVFDLEVPVTAAADFCYVTGTLFAMSVMLVGAVERQQRLVDKLRHLADIDPLTGLATRRVMVDAARASLAPGAPGGGAALVLIDIDHFKDINDTYGHPVGDDALVHLAEVLRGWSRPEDVKCRLGGDEFGVLLPGCPYDVAVQRAEELIASVRSAPVQLAGGRCLRFSLSVGVAHGTDDPTGEARYLFSLADAALYEAKRSGRDQVGRMPPPAACGPRGPEPAHVSEMLAGS